ncbi:hypothetical protein PBI_MICHELLEMYBELL_64 [Mycobacterium phage MichelleMyBell]|uniref:Uncharacterized protein n=1 Tax=Mycobacterium phage MichelleMyBell TaxID=1445726 RepID=W0LKC9_9CAUD|nr:hypothetical protein CH20_gp64 [Mycobacterium phage MichelleMyBell]AHG24385.1 hypothetical protein PBI_MICHELLEMYBELL_64 [Mycobacterium phage MichelleMyBell]
MVSHEPRPLRTRRVARRRVERRDGRAIPELPRPTRATGEPPVNADKSSRTLTAGQLIAQLLKVPADTPVVMSQEDDPLGNYGVRRVEFTDMQRDPCYADGPGGRDSWHRPHDSYRDYDPPQGVVFLGAERPWQPTIDGEIALPELESGDHR